MIMIIIDSIKDNVFHLTILIIKKKTLSIVNKTDLNEFSRIYSVLTRRTNRLNCHFFFFGIHRVHMHKLQMYFSTKFGNQTCLLLMLTSLSSLSSFTQV